MLITSILLIAMLGAIVLATGSVEEDKAPSSRVKATIAATASKKAYPLGLEPGRDR